jgi:hypothetical protein
MELPIYCGRVVRLLHSETDVFLATSPSMDTANIESSDSLVILEPAEGFDRPGMEGGGPPPSAYSMWLVEYVNTGEGRPLRYDEPIRLRNIATGGYFTPKRGTFVAKQIVSWSQSTQGLSLLHSSVLRLRRLPEHEGDDDVVKKRSSVWFTFDKESASNEASFVHVSDAREQGMQGVGPKLVMKETLGESDGFTVYPVDPIDVTATFQVRVISTNIYAYIIIFFFWGPCQCHGCISGGCDFNTHIYIYHLFFLTLSMSRLHFRWL